MQEMSLKLEELQRNCERPKPAMNHIWKDEAFQSKHNDVPTFNRENIKGWMYKAKNYFRFHNVPDDKHIHMDTLKMEWETLWWLL